MRAFISAANENLGSQGGSQHRQAPGYARPQWTSVFAGKGHTELRPATSGDGPGLIHTEEVTGSIPVSPTSTNTHRGEPQKSAYSSKVQQ